MEELIKGSLSDKKNISRHDRVTFRKYEMQQDFLFPPSTEDYLPPNHIARLVSAIVDRMDLSPIVSKYKGGGVSAYHPGMMLKVWLLGFIKKIYTSRKLEKALTENIAFMWISGRQNPDHKTLSNFRAMLADDIKVIFRNIVKMGLETGIIEGKDVFMDHTKIQADANPYKMLWKKSVKKRTEAVDAELDMLFEHIQKLNEKEDADYGNSSLDDIKKEVFSEENLDSVAERINSDLNDGIITKEDASGAKKKLKRAGELLKRKERLAKQEEILDGRSGCSTTDSDASAMKMKRSDEIRPGYNEGVVTENGFITAFDVSRNPADSVSFISLAEEAETNLGKKPESLTADAGYGSLENYEYLKEKKIENYVQYPGWFREGKFQGKFSIRDFQYDPADNSFICMNSETLTFTGTKQKTTATGFKEEISVYSAPKSACALCPKKAYCTEYENKNLHVNWKLEEHKKAVRENLRTEKGTALRKKRSHDVETVFGDRKWNQGRRRYLLRSLPKVTVEAGLHSIAHNLKKMFFYIHSVLCPWRDFREVI
ncbi:MAG TPA: IS1182 family transposase [Leptospiraceae bacterium]|nr:IS1182 family transposase [Leptospiraceae bacterium]HNF25819.1 IS1182 family transposase [Leptospiraceae bacterium]